MAGAGTGFMVSSGVPIHLTAGGALRQRLPVGVSRADKMRTSISERSRRKHILLLWQTRRRPAWRKIQPAVGQLDFVRPGQAQPDPDIEDPNLVRSTLLAFLGNLIDGLYFHAESNANAIETAGHMRDAVRARPHHRYDDIVMDLRDIFSKREWTAVLIPSGFKESTPPITC